MYTYQWFFYQYCVLSDQPNIIYFVTYNIELQIAPLNACLAVRKKKQERQMLSINGENSYFLYHPFGDLFVYDNNY